MQAGYATGFLHRHLTLLTISLGRKRLQGNTLDGCRADGMRHADQRTCGFYIPLYVYRYLPADTGTLIRQDFPFLIRNRAAFPYSIGNLVLCGLATGGQPFMDLMLEENTGRFVGKMSYPSHHNPLWYNFLTIIWGWTPWTLVLLISLFGLKWNEMHLLPAGNSFTGRIRKVWDNIRSQSPYSCLSG